MLKKFILTVSLLPLYMVQAQPFEKVDEISYFMLPTDNYLDKRQAGNNGLMFKYNIQEKSKLQYLYNYYDVDGRKLTAYPNDLVKKQANKTYILGNGMKPVLRIFDAGSTTAVSELTAPSTINELINKKPEKSIPEYTEILSFHVIDADHIVYNIRHVKQATMELTEYTDYNVIWDIKQGKDRVIIPLGFPEPGINDAYEKNDPKIAVWSNQGYYNGLFYYTRRYSVMNKKTDAFESCTFVVAVFDQDGKPVSNFKIDGGISPSMNVPQSNNKINEYRHVMNIHLDQEHGHFYTYAIAKNKSMNLVLTKTTVSGKQEWKTEQPLTDKMMAGVLGNSHIHVNYTGKVILYFLPYSQMKKEPSTKYIFADADGSFLKADASMLAAEKEYNQVKNQLASFLQNNKDLSLEKEFETDLYNTTNIFLIGNYYYVTLKGPKRTYLIYRYKI